MRNTVVIRKSQVEPIITSRQTDSDKASSQVDPVVQEPPVTGSEVPTGCETISQPKESENAECHSEVHSSREPEVGLNPHTRGRRARYGRRINSPVWMKDYTSYAKQEYRVCWLLLSLERV